jgi:branched-chain amino acid transport system permease protein
VIGFGHSVPLAGLLNASWGTSSVSGRRLRLAIIAIILLAPDGIYWRIRDRFAAEQGAVPIPAVPAAPALVPSAEAALAATQPMRARQPTSRLLVLSVSRAFGGPQGGDDVSLTVAAGTIHGIIGPNGAGKTTLFNVINGFLGADAGSIRFDGSELTGRKPHAVCRLGVGRTFQVVRAFPRMTVLENVIVGAYAGASTDVEAERQALAALDRVGLGNEQAHAIASRLTTKQLRLMELARALASRPRLLLLDETLAGLGHEELEGVLQAVRQVNREGITVVIIEHTMHAMVKLADRFSVLDHGRLIAQGPPAEIVQNSAVIEAYLCKKWMDRAHDTLA